MFITIKGGGVTNPLVVRDTRNGRGVWVGRHVVMEEDSVKIITSTAGVPLWLGKISS